MRHRATGMLFVLSGTCFLAGVLDPPILPTWGGSATEVMATASAHRAAWFASTWLITLSIVAGWPRSSCSPLPSTPTWHGRAGRCTWPAARSASLPRPTTWP
jgi:hypothetical protein